MFRKTWVPTKRIYNNPSIYVASINVASIYVIKFWVLSNFKLRRSSIYVAFFGTNCDVHRAITVLWKSSDMTETDVLCFLFCKEDVILLH